MADLDQIKDFLKRYQETQETVRQLTKLRNRLQGVTKGIKAAVIIYEDNKQPFFRHEMPLGTAATYLQGQLSQAETKLSEMTDILSKLSIDTQT